MGCLFTSHARLLEIVNSNGGAIHRIQGTITNSRSEHSANKTPSGNQNPSVKNLTLAMLTVTAAIAATVYEWVGVEILRRAWLNADLIWTLALLTTGALLVPA
jgi:hypothetical protein